MTLIVIVIVAVVLVGAGWLVVRRRRRQVDPVVSFRRQIDALSPEARRPTIDQVKAVDDDEPDAP